MKRDIILILEEGIMLGAFGGGVVTAFEEADLYSRILGVCASSSGSHNAAYFLSKQTKTGSSIYFDDLCGNKFINKKNIFKLIRDLISFRHKKSGSLSKVADLDYLMEIEKNKKRLDISKIRKSPIHFFVRVFDIINRRHKFIDAKQDVFKAVQASSSSPPFYPKIISVNGSKYFDGSVIRSKGFLNIIKRNQDKKIIYVVNRRKSLGMIIKTIPIELLEFLLLSFLVGPRIAFKKLFSIFNYPTMKELRSFPNLHLVLNKLQFHATCTDRKKILAVYNHGLEQGREILEKI